jgi:hypothetical protein
MPMMVPVSGVSTPSVGVIVEGGFNGTVHHFGGAELVDGKPVPNAIWQVGASRTITVRGRKNAKGGNIVNTVIAVTEAKSGEPGLEVE